MRSFVVSGLALLAAAVPAEQLMLDLRGDLIFTTARHLDLIQPRLLKQLKNGGTVAFDFHLGLWSGATKGNTAARRSFERFVVSYDLWEEKFAVASLRKPQVRAAGLAGAAISNWCLQQVALPTPPRLEAGEKVWVRLDVRAVENRRDVDLTADEGMSLTNLIEVFSRTGRAGESRWTLESGAVPIATLRARAAEQQRETP